ncbi:hypothetical protein HDV01_004593 [Terramyces sp. JEL0728]|nr:hypothetical protein HDV01_004593 [Terramyces sp. JEL0728]
MIYVISDEPKNQDEFIQNLQRVLDETTDCFIQVRAKSLGSGLLGFLSNISNSIEQTQRRRLLLNVSESTLLESITQVCAEYSFGGIHLTNAVLSEIKEIPGGLVVAGSCHSQADVERANQLELDFVVLSPVKYSTTCPSDKCLGFEKFREIATTSKIPVYGLGGLSIEDMDGVIANGGCGVAAISCFWHRHLFK